jgi:hypothetical protein
MIKDMANVEEINLARPKLQKALDYVKNGVPDSDIEKVNDIYKKYGIEFETDKTGLPNIAHTERVEESTASMFDTDRNLIAVQDHMKECFYKNLSNFVKAACRQVKDNGGKINVSEVIKDASECSNIVYDKLTVVFDAEETKDMAKNSTFGTCTVEKVTAYVKKFLGEENQLDRYDLDELKSEIENLANTYVHPLSKKAIEEEQKVSENEASNKENEHNIIADDQSSVLDNESVRSSFSLNPDDIADIKGDLQPMVKDDSIVKEQVLNH